MSDLFKHADNLDNLPDNFITIVDKYKNQTAFYKELANAYKSELAKLKNKIKYNIEQNKADNKLATKLLEDLLK